MTDRSRKIAGALGAALTFASFGTLSFGAGSADAARDEGIRARAGFEAGPSARANALLPVIRDPFARSLGIAPRDVRRPVPARPPDRNQAAPRVQAIVEGNEDFALIDDGAPRIVGVGDRVQNSRVVRIGADVVELEDHRLLRLDDGRP